jgi:hypothetical protein
VEASDKLQCGYTPADASSGHRDIQFKHLDWFSSLSADGISSVCDMMAEADPDFVFGADIVRSQSHFHSDCPDY